MEETTVESVVPENTVSESASEIVIISNDSVVAADALIVPEEQSENKTNVSDVTKCDNLELDCERDDLPQTEEDKEVEKILKGILKRQRNWDQTKRVNFDLALKYIPFDEEKDYTVEIQIIKEWPKKVVSYRELFKKKAEEERLAKLKKDQEDEDDLEGSDDENIIIENKFARLKLAEPVINCHADLPNTVSKRPRSPVPIGSSPEVDITNDEANSKDSNQVCTIHNADYNQLENLEGVKSSIQNTGNTINQTLENDINNKQNIPCEVNISKENAGSATMNDNIAYLTSGSKNWQIEPNIATIYLCDDIVTDKPVQENLNHQKEEHHISSTSVRKSPMNFLEIPSKDDDTWELTSNHVETKMNLPVKHHVCDPHDLDTKMVPDILPIRQRTESTSQLESIDEEREVLNFSASMDYYDLASSKDTSYTSSSSFSDQDDEDDTETNDTWNICSTEQTDPSKSSVRREGREQGFKTKSPRFKSENSVESKLMAEGSHNPVNCFGEINNIELNNNLSPVKF